MRESPLDVLLQDGVIDEVVGRLNSGKEADIFLVQHRGRVVAAKVYRDRHQRSFKHNADYKEGRAVRNSRTQRAIDSGSRFGRQMSDEEWGTTEARALHRLEAHGVRVPVPVMSYEGVLLMELVKDAEGHPAPRLIEMRYEPEEARAAYLDLRAQIVKMLCAEIVHGDLSPYNILAAEAGPTIIDFPQIVSPAGNSRAEFFFLRDYRNVHDFFANFDRSLSASWEDGRQIWNAYRRRELTPEFVPSPGRARAERTFQPPPQRSHEGAPQRPRDADAPRPQPPRRPYDAPPPQPRPQNPQRRYEAQLPPRPQGGARPQNGPRPHDGPRPNDGPRPQNAPRAHDAPRPQHGPRPQHNGPRPQSGPRPPQGPPAKPDDAPPPLRSVRSRPKVYTSPDLPPRGVKRPEDEGPPGGGSHRRRPKRRF